MSFLENIGRDSFRGKIFFVLVTGSVSIVLTIAALWLGYAWYAVERTVHRDLQLIAERTAGEIDQYLTGKTNALMTVRELLSYPDKDRFKLKLMLKRVALEFDQFNNVTLFDLSGTPVAASDDGPLPNLPEEIFKITARGEVYRSSMLLTKDNLPYIKLAFPLFWQGEVFRIITADINILDVWDRIDEIRIGETGRASILSEKGVFLADTNKDRVLGKQLWQEVTGASELFGEKESIFKTTNSKGRTLQIAHAPIPSAGWTLVIEQEQRESLHFLIVMFYNALIVVVLCIFGAYYVAAALSRRLSTPIEALHKGVAEMTEGNFQYQVPTLVGREMETLGRHLNTMARTLKEKEKTEKDLAAAERLAVAGRLAADVAHEVNNPLGVINNYLHLIKREMKVKDDPIRSYIDILKQEIGRIARIISSFKDFYKGAQTIELKEVDLLLPLQDALTLCRLEMKERGIAIEEILNEGGIVMAESDRLEQIFLNFIKNAMDAMPEGGRLTVEASREGERKIAVSFSDTGMGIKEEHLPRIFDPFFSTKGVTGTGLGLSVTYGIITSFKGRIDVESEEGKGTTFTVLLPLV